MGALLSYALKGWFSATFTGLILTASGVLNVLNLLPFLPQDKRQRIASRITGFFFWMIFVLNPQFSIERVEGGLRWDDMFKGDSAPFLMINHTSQLDAFFFTSSLPYQHVWRFKTLAKISLFRLPIFGTLLNACGHFPVHFNSSKTGDFKVDKTAQAEVMSRVDDHISKGGGVSFYPEGQINRKDSFKLQQFRRGSFGLAVKHKMEMFGFLHTGVEDAWPHDHAVGGHFATIKYKIFRVPNPPEGDDLATYAEHVQEVMQREMELLKAHGKVEIAEAQHRLDEAVEEAAHGDARIANKLREGVDMVGSVKED